MHKKKKPSLVQVGTLGNGMAVYQNPAKALSSAIESELPGLLDQITPETNKKHRGLQGGPYVANLSAPLPSYRVEIRRGDKLVLAQRVGRDGYSVFVSDREPVPVDVGTVILSFHGLDVPRNAALLVTAFVGTPAPREPWDDWYSGGKNRHEAKYRQAQQDKAVRFWTREALVFDENMFPLEPGVDHIPFSASDPKIVGKLLRKI